MDKLSVVDIDTVAAVLHVSDRQIRTWVKDFGCPARKEGRSLVFDWAETLAWYVDYASAKRNGVTSDFAGDEAEPDDKEGLTRAMLRKTRAEADIKEMSLGKLRGEMIQTADARTRIERLFGNLRTQMLSLPAKLTTRLAGERDMSVQEAIIREELETSLRELSSGAIVGARPEDALPADEDEPAEVDLQASAEPAEESLTDADFEL